MYIFKVSVIMMLFSHYTIFCPLVVKIHYAALGVWNILGDMTTLTFTVVPQVLLLRFNVYHTASWWSSRWLHWGSFMWPEVLFSFCFSNKSFLIMRLIWSWSHTSSGFRRPVSSVAQANTQEQSIVGRACPLTNVGKTSLLFSMN